MNLITKPKKKSPFGIFVGIMIFISYLRTSIEAFQLNFVKPTEKSQHGAQNFIGGLGNEVWLYFTLFLLGFIIIGRQLPLIRGIVHWMFPYFSKKDRKKEKPKKGRRRSFKSFNENLTFRLENLKGKHVDTLQLFEIDRHIICFGGSGSGKTFSFGKPVLSFLLSNRPGILIDPKGDLAEFANGLSSKHPVIYFNPDNPATSRINPLDLLSSKTDIIDFCNYFLSNVIGIPKDDSAIYFFNSCNSILSALIFFLKKNHPEYCTLPHVIGILLSANAKQIGNMISVDPESSRLGNILDTASGNEKNISSIMSTFSAFFAKLDNPNIFYSLTSDNNVIKNPPNDPFNPYILLLSISSPSRQEIYAPIYSALAGTLLRQMNFPGKEQSFFFSDEFSVFKYPKFSLIPETARSNGIASILLMQDIEQLVRNYGKEEAISIIGNHSNHFVFKTRNNETLNYYESLLGKEDIWSESYSSGGVSIGLRASVNSKTKTTSIIQRDVLDKNKIIYYEKGQFFGVFNDSSHSITQGFRLNGSHYLKGTKNVPFGNNEVTDSTSTYDKVYAEVNQLLINKVPEVSGGIGSFKI